jgi:protein-S-isoprenylcysteine O-methyltransferase Ste14
MSTNFQEAITVLFILGSSIGFFLFIIYDINSIKWQSKFVNHFFYIGCFLIITNTLGAIYRFSDAIEMNMISQVVWISIILSFLILLIFTLFFALPFDSTYVKNDIGRKTYTKGMYALCRHPGVIWFAGLYFSLFFWMGNPNILYLAIVLNLMNFVYIVFQDLWTFPQTFIDYEQYKETTPFIIPNCTSIHRMITTIKSQAGE